MKHKKVMALRLLVFVLLFAGFADCVSAAQKGVVIAMGGGDGTPEIYEKWKSLGGGKNAHVVLIPTANNPGEDTAGFQQQNEAERHGDGEAQRQVIGIAEYSSDRPGEPPGADQFTVELDPASLQASAGAHQVREAFLFHEPPHAQNQRRNGRALSHWEGI